jgi:hypothetical protein
MEINDHLASFLWSNQTNGSKETHSGLLRKEWARKSPVIGTAAKVRAAFPRHVLSEVLLSQFREMRRRHLLFSSNGVFE